MIENEREKLELKEYKRKLREEAADEREAKTGMRQSKGAMIAKIVCGCLFIAVSFTKPEGEEWTVGYFLTAVILGVTLIAWGLVPYMKAKKIMEQREYEETHEKNMKTYAEAEIEIAMKKVDIETETDEIKQLRKFKSLLDQGLITEADYEKKKKKLLKL